MASKIKVEPLALTIDFSVLLGDSWKYSLDWVDSSDVSLVLSSYTALLQVKVNKTDAVSLFQLSTQASSIILADTGPNILFEASPADINALTVGQPYNYGLQLTSPTGTVTTVARGVIVALQDSTR